MPSEEHETATESELSRVPTDVITIVDEPATLQLLSADDRLEAQVVSNGTIAMLGFVAEAPGAKPAVLALKVDANFVSVSLAPGLQHQHLTEQLRDALPQGYELARLPGSSPDVLILKIVRRHPVAAEPLIEFKCDDPGQCFIWAGNNRLQISGACAHGPNRASLALTIDGKRLGLWLMPGDLPITTALRLRDALPARYSALVELPHAEGGDVSITILARR